MQGTQNNTDLTAGGVVDLDALLADRALKPAQVKLGGRTFQVRTDLTSTETVQCLALIQSGQEHAAFTFLVGTPQDIAALKAALAKQVDADREAAKEGKRADRLELPIGKNARALYATIEGLPRMHSALAQSHIYRASKALAQYAIDDESIHKTYGYSGESSASSSES